MGGWILGEGRLFTGLNLTVAAQSQGSLCFIAYLRKKENEEKRKKKKKK